MYVYLYYISTVFKKQRKDWKAKLKKRGKMFRNTSTCMFFKSSLVW